MGGTSLPTFSGSRIANATRTWQAAEEAAVTGWPKANHFIVALACQASPAKPTPAMSLQLRWRNSTDAGSFAALSGSGELTWTATTDLVNANAVATGEAGCTGVTTWVDGTEREGANAIAQTLATGEWTEHQWAINGAGGLDGKTYEFELYDATSATAIGTALATLTTAAGAPPAVDGTVATTQAAQTHAATGEETIVGTASTTQAVQTHAATGEQTLVGTAATTQVLATTAATGEQTLVGTSATTAPMQQHSATDATGGVDGTAATTQVVQTTAASGQLIFAAVIATTQAIQVVVATGQMVFVGTIATTQAMQTHSATDGVPGGGGVVMSTATRFIVMLKNGLG